MKGIVALIIFMCLCALLGSMLLTKQVVRDPGRQLSVAFGIPAGEKIQVHLGVPPMVPEADPLDNNEVDPYSWEEWVDLHFRLRDATGNPVQLMRMGTSALMLDDKVAGAPVFVIWAEVKMGESYEFDFVPILAESKRYRYSFAAPPAKKKVGRPTFAFVPDGES